MILCLLFIDDNSRIPINSSLSFVLLIDYRDPVIQFSLSQPLIPVPR